jgi:peptidoglycan hydrolase CwlO-like protein
MEQMIKRLVCGHEKFMKEQKVTNQQVVDKIKDLGTKINRLTTHGKMLETQVAQLATRPSQQPSTFHVQSELMQREHVDVIFLSIEEKGQKPEEQEKCTETRHESQSQAEVEQMESKDNIDAPMPKQVKEGVLR